MASEKNLLLTHRWFDKFYLIFLPVLIAPLLAGAFLFFMAQKVAVPPILYGAFACSLVLAYCTLAVYVNSSSVFLETDSVVVRCGPLPWPSKRLHLAEGIQFKGTSSRQGTSSTHYNLLIVQPNGSAKRVISGLSLEQVKGWAELMNEALVSKEPVPENGDS